MRKYITKHNHPISNVNGRIKESRYIFYEETKGKNHKCRWCGMKLVWRKGNEQSKYSDSLCVDHLDRNEENNKLSNLTPSCRQCNANRHKNGRRKERKCLECKESYLPKKPKQKYCSISCSSKNKPKRGITSKHGTRSRYMTGCRCSKCVKSNSSYWKKWYHTNKTSKYASKHCWGNK